MFDQPEKFAAALDAALAVHGANRRRNERRILRHTAREKAGLQARQRVSAPGAPPNYRKLLAPLPEGVEFQARVSKTTDIVHLFTTSKAELAKNLARG